MLQEQKFSLYHIFIIIGFIVVAYMIYSLTSLIYRNYQFDQHIKTFESKNQKIALDNRKKAEDYYYYTSEAYAEKIAKQNLGLVNPGEKVIVLTQEESDAVYAEIESEERMEKRISRLSNPQRWWSYFFIENYFR